MLNAQLSEYLDKARSGLRRWPGVRVQFAMLALGYWITFVVGIKGHGVFNAKPAYWTTWADQNFYLQSATAFAHENLSPTEHWYPLLYPMLGAPFTRLTPAFPFAVPNFLLVLATFWGFRRICAHFSVGGWSAFGIFLATTLVYPGIGNRWIEPWTTTLSAALIWLALASAADLLTDQKATRRRAWVCLGALLGLIPLARPGDVIVSLVIGSFVLKPLLFERRDWPNFAVMIGGALVTIVPYAALHLAIYGAAPTAYMRLSAAFGLDLATLPWKTYLILIEPQPWFPDGAGLLRKCPWVAIGVAGLAMAAVSRERRTVALLLTAAMVAYAVMILVYVDLLPSGLWRYHNIHYFKWLLPLMGLFCWTFVRDLRRVPVRSAAAIVAVLAATCIRYEPVAAARQEPARLLLFAGSAPEFHDVYAARSVIRDSAGQLRNFYEFHQVPDGRGGVLAIALRRDFRGGERWWDQVAYPGVPWPVAAPGMYSPTRLAGTWPRAPIARFKPNRSFGMPCWLPGYRCMRKIATILP